jgi:GDPmannose 4,6-dehydratase
MKKHALITGITGQDGAYLARFLLEKGYEVYGTFRRSSTPNFWRLCALDLFDKVNLIPADMTDMASLLEAVTVSKPQEVYNLAAQSFVSASFEKPLMTTDVDGLGATRLLEVIRLLDRNIRYYQASSSEVFGNAVAGGTFIDENTAKAPASPYAAAKLYSYHTTIIYRQAYGLFASNGVLFNHESPLRGLEFVTRKISNAVAQIKLGLRKSLPLGNMEACRDWGFADEYVRAMWQMLQTDTPDDFVIATGVAHSVRELVQTAFAVVDLDWEQYVRVDDRLLRPVDVSFLLGNASKARDHLGWKAATGFKKLVETMVNADLDRWTRCLKGEIFPWDAPNYPDDLGVISRARHARDPGR